MQYLAKFYGRKLNVIGIFYSIEAIVEGKNQEEARLKLCEKFEHIMYPTFRPLDHPLFPRRDN